MNKFKIVVYSDNSGLAFHEVEYNFASGVGSFNVPESFLVIAIYDPFEDKYVGLLKDVSETTFIGDTSVIELYAWLNDVERFYWSGVLSSFETLGNFSKRQKGITYFPFNLVGDYAYQSAFANGHSIGLFNGRKKFAHVLPYAVTIRSFDNKVSIVSGYGYANYFGVYSVANMYVSELDGTRINAETNQLSLRAETEIIFDGAWATSSMFHDSVSRLAFKIEEGVDHALMTTGDGFIINASNLSYFEKSAISENVGWGFYYDSTGVINICQGSGVMFVLTALDYSVLIDAVLADNA